MAGGGGVLQIYKPISAVGCYRGLENKQIHGCYAKKGARWSKCLWDIINKKIMYKGENEVDTSECSPISGKSEGERLYTHFKYNMVCGAKEHNIEKIR